MDALSEQLDAFGSINAYDEANGTNVKDELIEYGKSLGKLYTDFGLPIDMSLARIEANKDFKLLMLDGALAYFIEHKRNSGASESAIERTRKSNRKAIENFIKKGEVGIY